MDGAEDGLPQISGVRPMPRNERKPKTRPTHPTYSSMIREAVVTLKERRGSSRQAISKYLENHYELGRGSRTRINSTLNRMVQNEKLLQTKGTGATGSFKINKAQDNAGGASSGSTPAVVPAVAAKAKSRPKKRKTKRRKGAKRRKSPKKKKTKRGRKSPKKKTTRKKKKSPRKKRKSPKKKRKSPKKKRKSPKKKTAKRKKR